MGEMFPVFLPKHGIHRTPEENAMLARNRLAWHWSSEGRGWKIVRELCWPDADEVMIGEGLFRSHSGIP